MIAERNVLERAYKFISSARALDFGEDRVCMWAVHLSADIAAYLASVDTHPKGGDVQQAPAPLSGAVDAAGSETPKRPGQ